jgi:hypothetical protein
MHSWHEAFFLNPSLPLHPFGIGLMIAVADAGEAAFRSVPAK